MLGGDRNGVECVLSAVKAVPPTMAGPRKALDGHGKDTSGRSVCGRSGGVLDRLGQPVRYDYARVHCAVACDLAEHPQFGLKISVRMLQLLNGILSTTLTVHPDRITS